MKIIRAIRVLVWLPFAVLSNLAVHCLICLLVLLANSHFIIVAAIACSIVRGVAKNIEWRLRPPKVSGPKLKPLVAGLVKAVTKTKATSPGRASFTRSLSPQLKALLKQPANQKPAAVKHEEANIAGYQMERAAVSAVSA